MPQISHLYKYSRYVFPKRNKLPMRCDALRNSSIYDSKATLQNNLKGEKRFFKIVSFGMS